MTVAVVPGTPSVLHDGEVVYFCCAGCKAKFELQRDMPRQTEPFVAGLVLGAGGSRRLGRPKQLLAVRRRHAARPRRRQSPARARSTSSSSRSAAPRTRSARGVDLAGAEVVVNDGYGAGCSSSIAAALGVVDPRCEVLVLMLGDQPGVTAARWRRCSTGRGDAPLAICRYDDGRGHPIAFARSVFAALADLHGDKGVWRLLDQRAGEVARGARSPGPIPLDVDTPEDYEAVVSALGSAPAAA